MIRRMKSSISTMTTLDLSLVGSHEEIAQLQTNLEEILAQAGYPVPSNWRSADTAEDIANMMGWWVEVGLGQVPEYDNGLLDVPENLAEPMETQENPTRAVEVPEPEEEEPESDDDEEDFDDDEDDDEQAPPPKPKKKAKTKKSKKSSKKGKRARTVEEDED